MFDEEELRERERAFNALINRVEQGMFGFYEFKNKKEEMQVLLVQEPDYARLEHAMLSVGVANPQFRTALFNAVATLSQTFKPIEMRLN